MERQLRIESNRKNILEVRKIKTSNIFKQDAINYVPSLKSMAVVNVAISLCKQPDIRAAVWKHSLKFAGTHDFHHFTFIHPSENVDEIEKNIFIKLSHLPLPNSLKSKVVNIIKPIILQILKWIRNGWNDIECMDSIFWTTKGTIDIVKTFEQLVEKDTGKHIQNLYKLACIYCLEDSILNLWNKLPERVQKCLCNKKMYETNEDKLIAYWTSFLKDELLSFENTLHHALSTCSLNKTMFISALMAGNSFAVKYFWKKLTPEEANNNLEVLVFITLYNRKRCFYHYQNTNEYADIFYFLFMNNEEIQKKVLQTRYDDILMSLFEDFPWQRLFLPTIHTMWELIDETQYVKLLSRIVKEIGKNKTTDKLFRKLWCDSPVNLQKSFIQHMFNDYEGIDLLRHLLIVEDVSTIKIILIYAGIEEKKLIAYNLVENSRLIHIIHNFCSVDLFVGVLSDCGISCVKKI